MITGDVTLLSMLKTRMQWHQQRQKVLAENVSNAATPGYRGKDIRFPSVRDLAGGGASNGMAVQRTDAAHFKVAAGTNGAFRAENRAEIERTPDGNVITLEDEMLKVSQNQMDYQQAASIYQRSIGLFRTALGKKT